MKRYIFIALIIGGFGLGIVYPWYVNYFNGSDIGSWVMQENGDAPLKTPMIKLGEDDAPVHVFVDITPLENAGANPQRFSLRLAVSRDGHPLLSQVLSYQQINNDTAKNTPMRAAAGDINPVIAGEYTFSVAPADVENMQGSKIELVLQRGAKPVSDHLISAGLIAAVLGIYGLMRGRIYRRRF